jgi:hypothetical protein
MTGRNIGVLAGPLLLAEISAADWTAAVPVFGGTGAIAALAGIWLAYQSRSGSRQSVSG